jgi:hypothetical protein
MHKLNIAARSRAHCFRGKAISLTYCECVFVALFIQHAMRMLCIVLSSVACLVLPHFSHYLIHATILGKGLLNIKCVF